MFTPKPRQNHVQMKASFSKACTRETALVMTIVSRSGCAGCHTPLQATLYMLHCSIRSFRLLLLLPHRCKPPSRPTMCHKRRKLLQLLLHKNRKLSCPSSHTISPSQAENTGLPGPERRSVVGCHRERRWDPRPQCQVQPS